MLDKALIDGLLSQGLRLFPLKPNAKTPAIKNWQQEATNDPEQIYAWFFDENSPFRECNLGVATGRGLVVIDADCKGDRPGLASLELLEMMGLPETLRVKTPSGGIHVYLTTDVEIPNAVNLEKYPGIDIRGDGGYVVGPGSTIDGVPYAVD